MSALYKIKKSLLKFTINTRETAKCHRLHYAKYFYETKLDSLYDTR